jgi:hypothetical protein
LFRKQASKQKKVGENSKELFWTLNDQTRNAIRAKLLEGLAREPNASVRNKIGDAIGEIARQYVESGRDMRMARECSQADRLLQARTYLGMNCSTLFSRPVNHPTLACENVPSESLLDNRASSRSSTSPPYRMCF